MGYIIGAIIIIFILSALKDIIGSLLGVLLKLIVGIGGIILSLSIIYGVLSLFFDSIGSFLLFLVKAVIILFVISSIVCIIGECLRTSAEKNKKMIETELNNEIMYLNPENDYQVLYDSYKAKYSNVYLGETDLDKLVKEKLDLFCSNNKKLVEHEMECELKLLDPENNYKSLFNYYKNKYKAITLGSFSLNDIITDQLNVFCCKNKEKIEKGIEASMKKLGMVELLPFSNECLDIYGQYCIGNEDTTDVLSLIKLYIQSNGEEVLNLKDGDFLIHYPGATSGTNFTQNVYEFN